jgi:uncharacterized protein (DUF927 family)
MSELKTNAELARELWDNAQPVKGTPVEAYLRSRGITLPEPDPECLRCAPKLRHPNEQFFPAMIALPTNPKTGAPVGGIQRTFLSWSGNGKAQVERGEQKLSLGPCRGGVIRLAEPIDGKPLLIGEGIETVLTVMEATGLPGWATLGTSGLANLELPDTITEIILLAENDGGSNEKALSEIVPVLPERGIKALIARPPAGLKDFNDLVNGKSGHLPEAGRILVKNAIGAAAKSASEVEVDSEAASSLRDEDGRFKLTETGLSWRKDERGKWNWIAQPFEILGWARDAADAGGQSGDWGKLVRFKNSDGIEIERVVTLASLHSDPGALIGSLGYWGMDIKCTPTARRLFVEYLASVDVKERVTVVRRNGWHDIDGARAFALPGEVINAVGKERVILAKDAVGPYRQCGTLKDWTATVGALAADHKLLRFSIATALAGTLLAIGGFESGCFHFFGKSSEGKTTCLRVGASVWGSGADGGYLRTWRATANGLEAVFAGASDTCLPLDELGQVEGRELGQALYMATGGVGKQRMRRDATLKPSQVWRVIALSSGEFPIETKLNEDPKHGARAHAGQLVRAVDIPVSGVHGVFDDFASDDVDPGAFAEECKNATSTYYGTAGPEFVRQLIAQNILARNVREHVDSFVRSALRDVKDRHGQAARVAQRFGLVCAAGELGVQFGILPWEQSDPLNDATELLKVWLEERGGSTPYEARQAVAQVRHFIEAHGDSRFDDITTPDPDRKPVANRAGFRRDHGEARRRLIPPEVWRNEVCAGLNAREVAKTLAGLHMLEPDGEGKFSRSETVGGRKQRFYVLKPAIFEGWDEAGETPSEHLEHQAHIKFRVSQNRGSQE